MIGRLRRLLTGGAPAGFTGALAAEEHVLGFARVSGGGLLLATSLGLWLPEDDGTRRVGWHLISKATWAGGVLAVIEAVERETAGAAVLIADLPARRFVLDRPGPLPGVVHARVTGSIKSRARHELPGGGAWFVQRKVSGRDGLVLQVRADPEVDPAALRALAAEVAARLGELQ
ncbi:hypothetical protein [Actinophytocola sp.]|uniref:hypothetical protein n=1 Tax=Actinophytocola sp. TaxID=1872138 RepID=UPI002D7F43B8|nr:hypothetical protein [Actinophytocola sp.]HET9143466.1 hypothetical protein [Actinophytocola sp.]